MYPVTDAVKALYAAEQPQVLRITGTDKNGVAISITGANVVLGSFNIDRYSCNGNRLEVGTAIAAEMTVKLDNHDGTYNDIVFDGTELYVEVGIADWTQDNPTVYWMPCGYFTPDVQPRTASQITIHALDRMVKFDNSVPGLLPWENENHEIITDEADQPIYLMTDLSYPATIQSIIQTVCGYYNVPFTQDISGFPNYNFTVTEAPNIQQPTSYRNIIQWCAGIMGTCAWIDWTGSLRFSWYGNTSVYTCTPANRFSSDLHEDDVEITGVQYTNLQNYTVLAGRPEYTIDMTGNYLMAGSVTQILTSVNNAIGGYTYRPFSATIINAPYLWPMDSITFTDKNGNDHTCVLTNVNFGINGAMAIEGKGESMQAASHDALSGMTKEQGVLVEQAREATQQLDNSLTQEEIFNRLTDNGEEQGLILYNGKLYLNAEYIQAGTISANLLLAALLTVGGQSDGSIRILAANGNVIGIWDKNGITATRGNILLDYNSILQLGFNSDNTQYAKFSRDGMEIWLDGNTFIGTGSIITSSQSPIPDKTIGRLFTYVNSDDNQDRLDAELLPGHIECGLLEKNSSNQWIRKKNLYYDTDSFQVDDEINSSSFRVYFKSAVSSNSSMQYVGDFVRFVSNVTITGSCSVGNGASGTFRTADNKTVTVTNGIITKIV